MVATGTRAGDMICNMVTVVEAEMARMVAYVNDKTVPEVRRSSSIGLRSAAEQLGRLADHLDRGSRGGTAPAASAVAQKRPCA